MPAAGGGGPDPLERDPSDSQRLTWLLAGSAAILGLLVATQYQRSVELEARVEAVTAELGVAREKLSVYEQRMEVVRSHVNDLSVRMGALKQLVAD